MNRSEGQLHIPKGPEDLDITWLTDALRKGGIIRQARVVSFECQPLGAEEGHFGRIVRVRVTYDVEEPGAPSTLIAKLSSAVPGIRERPNTRAAYDREVRFYRQLSPRTRLRTAACFYGDVDPASGWHVLLLEDLAPARSGSRVVGCTPAQAKLVVEEIARFHADWWESPQLSQIGWLSENPVANDEELKTLHDGWWPLFVDKVGQSLPTTLLEMGQRLGEHRGRIARHLFETSPRTIIHADYQLDNLMFDLSTTRNPFAVVDWQFVRLGRGLWDVAYFLCQNLSPGDRRVIEAEVLREYQWILADHGIRGYGSSDVTTDYRLSLLHRFGSLISTIAAMPFSKDQIQMHIEVLLPRNIAAILDQEAGLLLA